MLKHVKNLKMNNTLYISKFCMHSKKILENLESNRIKMQIQIISVDTMNNIPIYVDRVPTLIIEEKNNRKILTDEELFDYIVRISHCENVEPYIIKEMKSTLSDNYSYLDEKTLNHSYVFINSNEDSIKINTPVEDDVDECKQKVNLDTFMAERDIDIKRFIQKD